MNPPFSAWREGAVYYVPTLALGGLAFALLLPHGAYLYLSVPILLLGLGILLFFRDPQRFVSAEVNDVLSPADGRIVAVEDLPETPYYEGPCRRVSIFLSVFSVHVNRAPFQGTVRKVEYRPGCFRNAMSAQSSDVNESNAVWLDTSHGPVTIRQISGAVARRIVCKTGVGDILARGEKFGMIKLGSRTELYLPPGTNVCVATKSAARAGVTVVARFREEK